MITDLILSNDIVYLVLLRYLQFQIQRGHRWIFEIIPSFSDAKHFFGQVMKKDF